MISLESQKKRRNIITASAVIIVAICILILLVFATNSNDNTEEVQTASEDAGATILTAEDVLNNAGTTYGSVVDYTCTSSGVDTWRVFHSDGTNIYLIADDYVPYVNLPTSIAENALNQGHSSYPCVAYFTNVLNDYTGSAWIRTNANTNAQNWLSYVESYPTSKNNNIKAVAYMMDTDSWSGFASDIAEYAIGGPTLELYCASYKVTHPNEYIVCQIETTNGYGYQVKWKSDSSYSTLVSGATQDDFNSIYIKSDYSNACGMWLASPSYTSNDGVMEAQSDGSVRPMDYSIATYRLPSASLSKI